MKDQILQSTRCIIKYLNLHIVTILHIFKKLTVDYNPQKSEKNAKVIFEKVTTVIAEVGVYATNKKKWDHVSELYSSLKTIYQTFKVIMKNTNLTTKEKKIVRIISLYLLCTIRVIEKIENISLECSSDTQDKSVKESSSVNLYKSSDDSTNKKSSYDQQIESLHTSLSSNLSLTPKSSSKSSSEVSSSLVPYSSSSSTTSSSLTDTQICEKDCKYTSSNIDSSYMDEVNYDKKNFACIIKKLKCVYKMINLLKTIICMLEKQFIEQINNANSNVLSKQIECSDVDIINKLMDIYTSQFKSVANKHCGKIFDDTCEPGEVKIIINLSNGKEIIICVIDNISVYLNEFDNVNYIIICVGKIKGVLRIMDIKKTYDDAIDIFKNNIENLESVKKALDNNQKIIKGSLETAKNFIKYKLR